LKVNLGVIRKAGQPDYGSVGASYHLELEIDAGLLERDLDGFLARVRSAYVAVHQAVHDELARLQAPVVVPHGPPAPPARPPANGHVNGHTDHRPAGPAIASRRRRNRSGRSARSRAGSMPTSTGCSTTSASSGPKTCRSGKRPG
jgi:hypothetical protein